MSEMKDMSGIQPGETPANQLRVKRIHRDNNDVEKLQNKLGTTCNPFSADALKPLVNNATGKAATQETKVYLLETLH